MFEEMTGKCEYPNHGELTENLMGERFSSSCTYVHQDNILYEEFLTRKVLRKIVHAILISLKKHRKPGITAVYVTHKS